MVSLQSQRKRSADLYRRNKADRREPSAYRGPQSAASGVIAYLVTLGRILNKFVPESGLSYQVPFGGMAPCGPLYSPQRGPGNSGLGLAESLRCSGDSAMKSDSDRTIESRPSRLAAVRGASLADVFVVLDTQIGKLAVITLADPINNELAPGQIVETDCVATIV